jgi:hypothetical protein
MISIGLMPIHNSDYDILPKTMDSLWWLDLVVMRRSDTPFDDVNQKNLMKTDYNTEWYVNLDADEVYSEPINFDKCPKDCNIISVDIHYLLNGRVYKTSKNWTRAFRKQVFDFSELAPFHKCRIPIKKENRKIWHSGVGVYHFQIRNYTQGMAKYERYKEFDPKGNYEHIKQMSEMIRDNDYTGVKWAS